MACPAWCKEPGCTLVYGAHPWGFSVASAALPTRAKADTVRINETEKRWERDMDAYKAVRASGDQPPRIDGCADLVARAETDIELNSGRILSTKANRATAKSVLDELNAA